MRRAARSRSTADARGSALRLYGTNRTLVMVRPGTTARALRGGAHAQPRLQMGGVVDATVVRLHGEPQVVDVHARQQAVVVPWGFGVATRGRRPHASQEAEQAHDADGRA